MIKTVFTPGLVALALLALAGPADAADCSGRARAAWRQAGPGYAIEATATGPSCRSAVVRLTVLGPGGTRLHRYQATADQNMEFHDATTKAAMKAALAALAQGQMKTSADLPDWKAGEDTPGGAVEFPFHVEEGLTRADYLAIRKARRPMVCYVQGMESQACVVLQTSGAVRKVGVQSFPG